MESHKIPRASSGGRAQTPNQQGVENHHYYQRWRGRLVIILLSAVRLRGMYDMLKALGLKEVVVAE
jgi:hypothetical protein